MPVYRVNKTSDYTCMSNVYLRDTRLSLKTIGLLSIMLSLPDDWDYSVHGMSTICREGIPAVRTALVELERFGYLKRTRVRTDEGKFDYVYDIYERPQDVPHIGFPHTVKPHTVEPYTDEPHTENLTQINTDPSSTHNGITDTTNHGISKARSAFEDKIDGFTTNSELREALKDYVNHRKQIKKALSERALDLCLKKLEEFSSDPAEQVKIVNQSIMQGWVGLFPLKQDIQQTQSKKKSTKYDFDQRDYVAEGYDDWGSAADIINRPRTGTQ